MGKKSKEVKYTPVLNANLLEGAFVGAMEQVFESINICNQHKSTSMSLEENVRALHEIAKAEMDVVLMVTEDRNAKSMRRKHACFVKRTKTVRQVLEDVDVEDEEDLKVLLKEILNWIQDAHLIMHEDTDPEIRTYLSEKGLSDDLKEAQSVVGVQ